MSEFKSAYAQGDETVTLVEHCLAALGPIPNAANFGFLYITDSVAHNLQSIFDALKQQTQITNWIGTVGLGISCNDVEIYDKPAIAIMVAALPEDSFRIFPPINESFDGLKKSTGTWLTKYDSFFGVVHADPHNQDIEILLRNLGQAVPGGFFVGGLASSQNNHPQIANDIFEGSASGVLFSPDIPVLTGLSQGCSPIGPTHTITQCERNILVELDNKPALDVFKQDIGEVLSRELEQVNGYIFAGLPIAGSDTGDYMVRNLMGIDPTNNLVAIGEMINIDDTIMFCKRDLTSAEEDLDRMLDHIKRRMKTPPKAALYYSCLGRGRELFGNNSQELKKIQAALGDIPLIGFFANGEISHDKLYGYTGVLTVFT